LNHAAAQRLKQFEAFVMSSTERELRQLRDDFSGKRKVYVELKTSNDAVRETLAEIRLEHDSIADLIDTAIAQNERRRAAIVKALTDDTDLAPDCPALAAATNLAGAVAKEIEARIGSLRDSGAEAQRKTMAAELRELDARVMRLLAHRGLLTGGLEGGLSAKCPGRVP
jgi:chromosome segregation ATPase